MTWKNIFFAKSLEKSFIIYYNKSKIEEEMKEK